MTKEILNQNYTSAYKEVCKSVRALNLARELYLNSERHFQINLISPIRDYIEDLQTKILDYKKYIPGEVEKREDIVKEIKKLETLVSKTIDEIDPYFTKI